MKFPTVIKTPVREKFDFFLFWWQHLSRVPRRWVLQSPIIIQESDVSPRRTKNPQLWAVAILTPIRGSQKHSCFWWPRRDGMTPGEEEQRRWESKALWMSFWGIILHESYIQNWKVTCLIRALWLKMKGNVKFTRVFSGCPEVMKLLSFHSEFVGESASWGSEDKNGGIHLLISCMTPSHTIFLGFNFLVCNLNYYLQAIGRDIIRQ